MRHLTVDEMTEFVSLTRENSAAIDISVAVNEHIRKCEKCLKRVRAFQMIYDEFSRIHAAKEFKKYICEHLLVKEDEKNQTDVMLTQIDGYR